MAPSDPRFGRRWRTAQVVVLCLGVFVLVGSLVLVAGGTSTAWVSAVVGVLLVLGAGGNLLVTRRGP